MEKNSVLIVDDEYSNIIILTDILKFDYTIYMAKNGQDAVKTAKKHLPDLILLDIVMPGMDGYEVLEALKNDEETKNIPVIFVTGLGSSEDEKKGLDMGAVDYISKPFSTAIVKLRIQNVFQMLNLIKDAELNNRYKTDFLAKMSHEIRTPMNVIIGMTELALREEEPESKDEHISSVKQAGMHLLSVINDIMDFSKIEKGKLEIKQGEYQSASILDDIVSIVRMRMTDSNVCFTVNADSKIPQTLYGDETRIRQAVLNILNNAVRYTEEGYISLSVSAEFTGEDSVDIIFEVKDTGIGIKTEDLDKLFVDFKRMDFEKNRTISGIGLGLAITHNIVKAMSGSISVKSEYGSGSVFTVRLPQKYNSSKPLASLDQPCNKSILVYETRDIYADSLIYSLDNLGADYTLIKSGTEMYEKMEKQKYDFLFISFSLCKKNEDTILKFGQHTKIVILTGFGEAVPGKHSNTLAMPVYCSQIADIINGVYENVSYSANNDSAVKFYAPAASVLIVDDIQTNLRITQGLLAPYRMHIDMCNGGEAAIEAIESVKYDLVFMDHMMPGTDGVEAVRRIREWDKETPIIALTANVVSDTEKIFKENGFNDFISKPIDTVLLNTILEKWIPKDKQIARQGKINRS